MTLDGWICGFNPACFLGDTDCVQHSLKSEPCLLTKEQEDDYAAVADALPARRAASLDTPYHQGLTSLKDEKNRSISEGSSKA